MTHTCDSERDADRLGGGHVTDVARVVAGVSLVDGVDDQMTAVHDLDTTSTVDHRATWTLPPATRTGHVRTSSPAVAVPYTGVLGMAINGFTWHSRGNRNRNVAHNGNDMGMGIHVSVMGNEFSPSHSNFHHVISNSQFLHHTYNKWLMTALNCRFVTKCRASVVHK